MLPLFILLISYGSIAAEENDCGTRYALNRFEPAILFGGKTLRSEFPWHVALYRHHSTNENPEYICGGSIIHSKVILTAAHCVYNETYYEIENSTFSVVAGKYYVSWNQVDPGEQRFKVLKIKIPETYRGFENRYAEDIALLELNRSINFTSAIKPVCIDWNSEYFSKNLPTVGTVVGWGLTENKTESDELLMANLNYIDFSKCRDNIRNGFSFFVTSDKFCAGVDNGTAVQRGDSGGGITFPRNTTNNKEQYYLFGIVSIKDVSRNNIAAFTDIRKHLHWLNITLLSIIDKTIFEVGCLPFPPNSFLLAECDLNGTSIDCNRSMKLGTKAKLHCKSSYHHDFPFNLYTETKCSTGLKWMPLPDSCIDCGKRYRFNQITPLVKYKQRTVSEYPWHVGLFRKKKNDTLEMICGGTIIHPKAVLTAAHCVYTFKLLNETEILVTAGKYKSSPKEKEHGEQWFQVKKIYIKNTYQGYITYKDDIAVLELNATINLSDYVMPVCMDWGRKLELYRNPLILGTAPGWGFTENNKISQELRSSKLSYLDLSQCIGRVPDGYKMYFPGDKFCAFSSEGTIPDKGDSGGSLTFPYYNKETGEEFHYLYGIVSVKLDISDELIAFTNVTYHLQWLKTILISIINNSS